MYTTDYTDIAAKISPEITALGSGGWTVTKPRALPETMRAGPSVIVRIEKGSARITILWELVDAPQWDLTINIANLPSKWDLDDVGDYALAICIAHNVARRLKYHLA
jgi:hypothetical protein